MDAFETKLPTEDIKKMKSQVKSVWKTLNEDNISFSVHISFVNLALVILGIISAVAMCRLLKCACGKNQKIKAKPDNE